MGLDLSSLNIPTMDEIASARVGKPILKGKTRLELKVEERPLIGIGNAAAAVAGRSNRSWGASLNAEKSITATVGRAICGLKSEPRSWSA